MSFCLFSFFLHRVFIFFMLVSIVLLLLLGIVIFVFAYFEAVRTVVFQFAVTTLKTFLIYSVRFRLLYVMQQPVFRV